MMDSQLSLMKDYGGPQYKSAWSLRALYCQCYFITIATILGTGVLGLPVTLSQSGFFPFLVTFTLNYIIQVLVIFSTLEVLQYCKALLSQNMHSLLTSDAPDGASEMLLLKDRECKESENVLFDICEQTEKQELDSEEDSVDIDDDIVDEPSHVTEPNLHILGKLFLNRYLNVIFMGIVFLHFEAVLISYSLAGSEAYGQIMQVNYVKVIPFFTWILAVIVIVARQFIQPVIAFMTLGKGSLIFATVLVTLWAGAGRSIPVSNDWRYIQGPILMGTVALGGMPMIMPMLFDKFAMVRDQMQGFRSSVIAGVTTCYILNVLWCWAVLSIVPQSRAACLALVKDANPMLVPNATTAISDVTGFTITNSLLQTTTASSNRMQCDPDITLEAANERGEISTVPLTKILENDFKDIQWIAAFIQVFILISITVSFLTIGSAMQHTVSGWVDDVASSRENCKPSNSWCRVCSRNWFWHYLMGLLCFSVVFVVAIMDPKGFLRILEKLASFCLNLMTGPFVFLMVRGARTRASRYTRLPLPTHACLKNVHYVFVVYYTAAVVYDVIISIKEVVHV